MTHFASTIYPHSLSGIMLIFDAFGCGKTMDNSVVLYTVFYGIFIFFRRIYRTYIRVSVFLHFTEIKYPNETKISLAYNFQKSPFFVVLLLKIAVFMNDFGEIRTFSDCL